MKNMKSAYLHTSEIIQIADGIVKRYYGKRVPQKVDVDAIAVNVLKQNILYESFAEANLDKIAFAADGQTPLRVWKGGKVERTLFPANTIVLERFLMAPERETLRRFILAHELSHIILSRTDPQHHVACFHTEQNSVGDYSLAQLHECLAFSEVQANAMAGSILLTSDALKQVVKKAFGSDRITSYGKRLFLPKDVEKLHRIADAKGVSYTTLCIQLEACNLLNVRSVEEYLQKTGVTDGS
ncbi:MAG: ImmA/IrrE family metallo-endopeptidase [Oscillospiraceae bacterium]|nr:ImmA/IrrE family metallo-endopeptidase [Oscillospiraceae bacterium]